MEGTAPASASSAAAAQPEGPSADGAADGRGHEPGLPQTPPLPTPQHLCPSPEEVRRIETLKVRAITEFKEDGPLWLEAVAWAGFSKGLDALLLQFVRARPGDDLAAFELFHKCLSWRQKHQVRRVFLRGIPPELRFELKRRLMNSFFFGHLPTGEPVYYNNMALADLNHRDLVPERASINDLSLVWVQEMEYREQVLFPRLSQQMGHVVNQMVVVFDTLNAGFATLRLLKYLKPTVGLNVEYFPESVKQIYVVNTPAIINVLFAMVKPFLPGATQDKIIFVRGNGQDVLGNLIQDPMLVPSDHGGQGPSKAAILDNFNQEIVDFLTTHEGYDCTPDGSSLAPELLEAFRDIAADPFLDQKGARRAAKDDRRASV